MVEKNKNNDSIYQRIFNREFIAVLIIFIPIFATVGFFTYMKIESIPWEYIVSVSLIIFVLYLGTHDKEVDNNVKKPYVKKSK